MSGIVVSYKRCQNSLDKQVTHHIQQNLKFGKDRENLTRTTIAFLLDLCELAGDVSSVAIEHGAVALGDLAGVVQHDHLGGEVGNSGGWLVLGVGSYVASPGKVIV